MQHWYFYTISLNDFLLSEYSLKCGKALSPFRTHGFDDLHVFVLR